MNKKKEQTICVNQDTNPNYSIKSLEDIIQEQLVDVKEQLKNTNADVSDIKQRVEEIDRNIKLEKYQEKVNTFLLNNYRDWQLRIIKADLVRSMAYYPCITYIKDGEFHHIKIKHQYGGEECALNIETNIREYKPKQFLIELVCKTGHDTLGPAYHYRYIVYNSETHEAEEMINPLKALIDLKIYLDQLGYPLPKRYLKKIRNLTPFNFVNSAPARRDYWNIKDYINERDLEGPRP